MASSLLAPCRPTAPRPRRDDPARSWIHPRAHCESGFVEDGARIDAGAWLGSTVMVGRNVHVCEDVRIDAAEIGDGVRIGPRAVLVGPIHVGAGAQISAGSRVEHDVPAGACVAGAPARVRRPRRPRRLAPRRA